MTMHKALYPSDDIDRLYVSRKEGGRGLASIQDNVDTSIRRFEDNIKMSKERLITAIRNNTNNTRTNRTKLSKKQKWEEKQLYKHFERETKEISYEKTWTWQRKGNTQATN